MTDQPAAGRRILSSGLLLAAGAMAGLLFSRAHSTASPITNGKTRIDQAAVIERLQSVAKLVTTEVALRDVVTYQNTRLGSTKRSLVVVTGKALVGFDLAARTDVRIDQEKKLILVTLPRPRLVSVDVVRLQTYDESRGLWNPFQPADRDTIYQVARQQLRTTASDLGVQEHAETGARAVFQALFAEEGYEVRVEFIPAATGELP